MTVYADCSKCLSSLSFYNNKFTETLTQKRKSDQETPRWKETQFLKKYQESSQT